MIPPDQQPAPCSDETAGKGFPSSEAPLTVLVPVFDDWTAAEVLLTQLDVVFGELRISADVLLVDDGSVGGIPQVFPATRPHNLRKVEILELRKNLGHQRALCVGLVHVQQQEPKGPVVILDADGEDSPSDLPVLLREYEKHGGKKMVFAARARRTEGLIFKLFYLLYRAVHRVLVGFDVRIGNFSIVPPTLLEPMTFSSDLWNHYAAAAIKARLPTTSVPVDRAKRFSGKSKMGFVGLIVHGLSAISVFGDVVGVRLLIASFSLGALTFGALIAALVTHFVAAVAFPGWTTYAAGILLLLLFLLFLLSLIFTFMILYSRGQSGFVPSRDSLVYKGNVRRVFLRDE